MRGRRQRAVLLAGIADQRVERAPRLLQRLARLALDERVEELQHAHLQTHRALMTSQRAMQANTGNSDSRAVTEYNTKQKCTCTGISMTYNRIKTLQFNKVLAAY